MIDHLFGRPSPSWKRTQVFLVIFFWLWRILRGTSGPPRILWLRRINRLFHRFTPWQLIVSTLTGVYAVRNFDKILGLGAPEPLSRLYSPSYYRATWITTGLDAGFATAMSIRPKWVRDICSIVFSAYYIIYANEADEKLRRFRAVPTVEMLRTTWEKTTNPYIRLVTRLPSVSIRRKILIPRPKSSSYQRPITAYIFSSLNEEQLVRATDLILDFPGGGFVAMSPEHHEERLRMWTISTGKPVLAIDYGKAPEYPYPFAIDEVFDAYRVLVESAGTVIGMSGRKLNIIMSGDSAGATLAVNVVLKILEHNASKPPHSTQILPQPLALVLSYAFLDFNFTSWMSPDNLHVLRSEQSSGNLPGLKELAAQKDHLKHISPLSMVGDKRPGVPRSKRLKRRTSWKDTLRGLTSTSGNEQDDDPDDSTKSRRPKRKSTSGLKTPTTRSTFIRARSTANIITDEPGGMSDADSDDEDDQDFNQWKEEDRPIRARVRYVYPHANGGTVPIPLNASTLEKQQQELSAAVIQADTKATLAVGGKTVEEGSIKKAREPIGTRLTMTSRTGYFQDRIISPSMMRAMAILYIGPHRDPDFATDYHLSPILAPSHMLAQFPPLLMQCGEKDPFVDDTVIFAGRVREAKRARKVELDLAISGKSARFGENLRMSAGDSTIDGPRLAALKKERDQLARETEEDWVQLVLFSDWSHGYLQMPTLMAEAKAVIEELAEWIDDAFVRHSDRLYGDEKHAKKAGWDNSSSLSPPRATESVRGPRANSYTSETETDDPGITFVPKRYQERTSPSGSLDVGPDQPLSKGLVPAAGDHHAPKDASILDNAASQTPQVVVGEDGLTQLATSLLGPVNEDYEPQEDLQSKPPAEAPKASGPRQTGQTISETELMRRRRLLDAHIFD